MRLANESVATAARVLAQYSPELTPAGLWRWECVVKNGLSRTLTVTVEDGFLSLAGPPEAVAASAAGLEGALEANPTLPAGVKLALHAQSRALQWRADVALLDEARLVERLREALRIDHSDGYGPGVEGQNVAPPLRAAPGGPAAGGTGSGPAPDGTESAPAAGATESGAGLKPGATDGDTDGLGELLQDIAWPFTRRNGGELTVELHEDSPHPARIVAGPSGVALKVEVARCDASAEAQSLALAVFLLAATSGLRLVRASAADAAGVRTFGLEVGLPADPDRQELEHGLAALSLAHRLCAREAGVLLDPAAARCYLAVWGFAGGG